MSSLRSLLLLVIVGGLVLFVIQNWTPTLPLVILGVPTQAIPLAFWMMGAIAAGAITTIAISALFRITAFTAAPRPSKRRGRSKPFPPDPDRGIDPRDVPYGVTDSPRTRIQSDDDWEPQPREVWDDWDAPVASSSSQEEQRYRSVEDRPAVDFRMRDREVDRVERIEYRFTAEDRSEDRQENLPEEEPEFYREPDSVPNFGDDEPPVYDAEYKVYRPAYRPLEEPDEPPYTEPAYSEPEYREPEYRGSDYTEPDYTEPDYRNEYPQPPYTEPEREVWDDWEEEPEPETPTAPPEPQRPIVEVQQTPKSQYRSGTVYSYSYRGEDEPKVDREASEQNRSTEKSTDEPKECVIVPPAPADDDDWGFDEDDEIDPARRSNRDDW